MENIYRYKSRLVGQETAGWNRRPSEIVELMAKGEVEFFENGQWKLAVKVSDTSFKTKQLS